MSARKRSISLAPEAWADYDDILLFGTKTWGMEQTGRYQASLDMAIDSLADFPEIGLQRDDLCARCRTLTVERHVIIYRIERDVIEVVRLLHERADLARHLPR